MPLIEVVEGKLWEYENFLSEQEVSSLLSRAVGAQESDWFEEDLDEHDMHHAGKTLQIGSIEPELVKKIDDRVAALFSGVKYMVPIGSIVRGSDRYPPTGFHRDNQDQETDSEHMYGVLMYLNDDFDGGEICYPEIEVEYKPKPGVLLIHYAGNLHGVNPVSNGTRYSMTSFAVGLDSKVVK